MPESIARFLIVEILGNGHLGKNSVKKTKKNDERDVSIHRSQEMESNLMFHKAVFTQLGVSVSLFQQALFQCCVT